MDIFFNELSVKIAANDDEAYIYLERLANLGKSLKEITESLEDTVFSFRCCESLIAQRITDNQTIVEFLCSESSDAVCSFLLSTLDSPYILDNDPKKTDYDLMSVTIDKKYYELTGIAAAYLKKSLVVSFDNDEQWNTCQLDITVNKLNKQADFITERAKVNHASKKKHIIDCHLTLLSELYNWSAYVPKFDPEIRKQNILPLIEIYSLHLGENTETVWDDFYQKISRLNANERISEIVDIAEKISKIHGWEKATGSLEKNNISRVIYTIKNSDFIVSVDTQHGEFEIHKYKNGNNHLGAISFDGKRFKGKVENRFLSL